MTQFSLNTKEIELIQNYRMLPVEQKRSLAAMIVTLASKQEPAVELVGNVKALRPTAA